jgi:hypothetical protein
MPQDINYELILYNHGSSDDTQYFFESINPHKQIDIKINGVQKAVVYFTIEGEYFLGISNDVIITPNSVSNMLRALKSDNSIGFIVPSTPNISNFQTISAPYYMYMDELSKWSLENNVYDEFRHEQRVRLCNPLWMAKSRSLSADHGIGFTGRYFTDGDRMAATFPDDLMSMLMRRNSLKNILMKDAYCHHFGSITIGNDLKKKQTNQALMYANGRRDFKNMFGIDPWGTGFCYDPELYIKNGFECKFDGHIEILGINCGLGSNSLKIKELYKERKHNLDVRLTNATDDRSFEGDLRGVSDNVRIVKKAAEVFSESDIKYHHIVVEDAFNIHINTSKFITLCLSHLVENGTLCIKFTDLKELKKVAERYKDTKIINNWVMILNSLRRLPV